MNSKMQIHLLIGILLAVFVSSRKDDDESRPYEFGFTIDGEQHRYEKKDVNGIIQGEFGFITADGVYHVTTYATDENGLFRILSMKNIRLSGPLDQPNYKGVSGQPKPNQPSPGNSGQPSKPQGTTPKAPYAFTTASTIRPGCGGCGIVATTKTPPGVVPKLPFQTPSFQQPQNGINQNSLQPVQPGHGPSPDPPQPQGAISPQNPANQVQPQQPQRPVYTQLQKPVYAQNPTGQLQTLPQYPQNPIGKIQQPLANPPVPPATNIQAPNTNPYTPGGQGPALSGNVQTVFQPTQNQNPNSINSVSQITVENGAINVPGRQPIPIKDKYPGMVEGLPEGITKDDITGLLYKFNYTLGFHGHYERGYKNGAKVGGYFVNGRDGISRIVTYVADEMGFRPKVKFINLGLDSELTPKEGSEKTFGLKGFEFVWYPI